MQKLAAGAAICYAVLACLSPCGASQCIASHCTAVTGHASQDTAGTGHISQGAAITGHASHCTAHRMQPCEMRVNKNIKNKHMVYLRGNSCDKSKIVLSME